MDTGERKARVAWVSVISNTVLVILKLAVGLLIGSVSVLSEAIHSGMDLLAAVIALFAVKAAAKPADKTHPFGHGKVENVSGTVEAILIFLAAGWIVYEAVRKLIHPQALETPGWGVAVMLLSAVVNVVVSQQLFRVGRETNSVALLADAWHLRTDVYTSAGVTGSLAIIWVGESVFAGVHFDWLDPVAAVAIALLILRAAYRLTVQSARDLLDVSLPADEQQLIHEHIAGLCPAVRSFHDLRTRRVGNTRFVEFHMLVDARMSVEESHRLTDEIADSIEQHYPNTSVTIHIEPCRGDCNKQCSASCLLNEQQRGQVREANGISGSKPRLSD